MRNFLFFIMITTLFSCGDRRIEQLLNTAESLSETDPEHALALIDSIENPKELSKSTYAEYILLFTQLRDKNKKDISMDMEIHEAVEYFQSKKDFKKAARANFYAGRVALQNEEVKNAINYFLHAKDLAEEGNDHALLGLIYYDLGFIYQKELDTKKARDNYNLAQENFNKAGNEKNSHYLNESIGYLYLLEEAPADSSLFYYQKALDYAVQLKDSSQISCLLRGVGIVYMNSGDLAKAEKSFRDAISTDIHKEYLFYSYDLLARTFVLENKIDSARYYADKLYPLISSNANKRFYDTYSYYLLLCMIDNKINDYQSAIKNYEQLHKQLYAIYVDKGEHSIDEIKEKYNAEKIQNAYNKAIIHRQYLAMMVVGIFLISLLLTWMLIYLLNRRKQQVAETEERMETLKEFLSSQHAGQSNRLKLLLLEKLDIIRRCAHISATPTRDQKAFLSRYDEIFNSDLNSMLDWENIYPLVNEIYPGIINRIGERCPDLSEKEKQICYMMCAGFSSSEIGFIMSYTYQTIRVRKVDVRKKLGFDSNEDFIQFLKGE